MSLPSSKTASVKGIDYVDITKETFHDVMPAVKEALQECSFFAFDCEMTGLFQDSSQREDILDDVYDRCDTVSIGIFSLFDRHVLMTLCIK
jgi:hypothetical protein